jgi:hypothetical protein
VRTALSVNEIPTMSFEARWIAGVTASALHAAECLLRGDAAADARLAAALSSEAQQLGAELAIAGLQPQAFFAQAIPLSARRDTPRQLAEGVLSKLLGPHHAHSIDTFTRRLTTLTAAFCDALPGVADELELRSGPLREQWEARGPGLLSMLRRLTEPDLIADSADVLLVQPLLGGGGAAYPSYNTLTLEAVLANPVASLPEIVRLAWLWAQLQFDLPKYSEHIGHNRLAQIGPLALVPPALAAAQEVELAPLTPAAVALALDTWATREFAVSPELLREWWTTYQATNSSWAAALGALDRMLSED